MAQDYTKRHLSYGEDGLLAISSLLSVMSASFSRGFIGGLPEMFFHEALLWQPNEPMQKRWPSDTLHDAPPSWSWAGWEGEIMAHDWLEHGSHLNSHYQHPDKNVWTKAL
jgi:hypothetical protein